MPASPTKTVSKVRHEEFCTPRPGEDGPRIENYLHFADDVATGRSRPVARVTRCLDCGATHYDTQEK